MKLLGIMQGVSLGGDIQNYLDFLRPDGTKFQLPVPEETVKVLLTEIYGRKPETEIAPIEDPGKPDDPPEDLPEGATTFGDEPEEEEPTLPRSEDEVPSV